jgi:hypothetical protein
VPYSLSAKYLPISRDKLIEMPQAFESRLFEMDCEHTGEFQRSVVRNAGIIEVKKITFSTTINCAIYHRKGAYCLSSREAILHPKDNVKSRIFLHEILRKFYTKTSRFSDSQIISILKQAERRALECHSEAGIRPTDLSSTFCFAQ